MIYLFYRWKFVPLNPFQLFPPFSHSSPLWQPPVCFYCLVVCSFVLFFRFHVKAKLFVFFCLTYKQRYTHTHTRDITWPSHQNVLIYFYKPPPNPPDLRSCVTSTENRSLTEFWFLSENCFFLSLFPFFSVSANLLCCCFCCERSRPMSPTNELHVFCQQPRHGDQLTTACE